MTVQGLRRAVRDVRGARGPRGYLIEVLVSEKMTLSVVGTGSVRWRALTMNRCSRISRATFRPS